jgi:hypothetical protein
MNRYALRMEGWRRTRYAVFGLLGLVLGVLVFETLPARAELTGPESNDRRVTLAVDAAPGLVVLAPYPDAEGTVARSRKTMLEGLPTPV